jgi:hypothetical protein
LTISDAVNSLGLTVGADTFALDLRKRETINISGYGSENFDYALGFGHQTISGFSCGDTVALGLSMFNRLASTPPSDGRLYRAVLLPNDG